jgi:hypothetical protein
MKQRLLARGAAAGVLVLTAGVVGVAHAATTPPSLSFVAATSDVTATRYDFDGDIYLDFDLGLHVIAGQDPFEIRAHRDGYDKPVTADRLVGKKRVALPAGTVTDLAGLKDFTAYTITDESGAVVSSYKTAFCGNSWSSARTRPDAPATTPYPTQCGGEYNPFTLGAVWGIQAGWDASVPDHPLTSFDLPVGKYAVTAALNPTYQKLFGISAEQSTVKVNVTVVDGDLSKGAALSRRSAHDERQVSEYAPGLRAPGKRPTVLKSAPKAGPRPDLRALPAWGISLSQEPDGKSYVNFGATVWNAGTSPLLVDGFRRSGTELMDAYQYFFDAKGNQVGSQAAGTMEWDNREGHKHWHFTDFAQYNLLDSTQKLSVRSGKEAFCLANTDAVDYTIPGAKWRPDNTDLSTSCGANTVVAVREVLDAPASPSRSPTCRTAPTTSRCWPTRPRNWPR